MQTNLNLLLTQLKSLKKQNNKKSFSSNQNHVLDELHQMLDMPPKEISDTNNNADLAEIDFNNRDLLNDGFDRYDINSNVATARNGSQRQWRTAKFKSVNQSLVNKALDLDIAELNNR